MSRTMRRIELAEVETTALRAVNEALTQLCDVRASIVEEVEDANTDLHSEVMRAEKKHDDLADRIEAICKAHALGVNGTPMELLDRLANYINATEREVLGTTPPGEEIQF